MTWLITGGAGYIGAHVEVTGDAPPAVVAPRRAGDAPRAVASSALAELEPGWTARRGAREMVEPAWQGWLLHHPEARRD
jgi:UDP-glucose 4-epimerase